MVFENKKQFLKTNHSFLRRFKINKKKNYPQITVENSK